MSAPRVVGADLDPGDSLSLPRTPATTKAQAAAESALRAAQERAVRHLAAGVLMLRGHGCTGRDCASDRHGTDRERLLLALQALGLERDRLTEYKPGSGYKQSQRPRAGGEQ